MVRAAARARDGDERRGDRCLQPAAVGRHSGTGWPGVTIFEIPRLLRENRDKLDRLAEALLVHEILDAEEIDRVLAGEVLDPPVRAAVDESATEGAGEGMPAEPDSALRPEPGVA